MVGRSDNALWLGWRVAQAARVQPMELVLIRDQAGDADVLREVAIAVEQAGATPLIELCAPGHLAQVLNSAPPSYLEAYDAHRRELLQRCQRVITLDAGALEAVSASPEALELWSQAQRRLEELEASLQLPHVLVAVPTAETAALLGQPLSTLQETLERAQRATLFELESRIDRLRFKGRDARTISLRTREGALLRCSVKPESWRWDDGYVDPEDVERGTLLACLPAGAVYVDVLSDSAEGTLVLEQMHLHFAGGAVARVESSHYPSLGEATALGARLMRIQIGSNPFLHEPIGWSLIDQHVNGAVTLDFGEHPLGEVTLHGNIAVWFDDWQAIGY